MFLPNSRTLIIVAAVVAVCGLAIAAFMHRGAGSLDAAAPAPQLAQPVAQQVEVTPYYPSQSNAVASIPEPRYASDGYYSSSQRPVYVRQAENPPVASSNTENREYVNGPRYSAEPRRDREVYRESTTTYHRGRSKAHSVEIVAGTAAAGAAIGAIAGGGKGAAIGAVSGGGAGFAYDRLTHNH